MPTAQQLYDHLFAHEPIEWNRLGDFQDVTMRLLAERLLEPGHAATYVANALDCTQVYSMQPPSVDKEKRARAIA